MASIGEDENVGQEETGRRTRSGRKATTPALPATRSTRRSTRKIQQELENEQITDEIDHQENSETDHHENSETDHTENEEQELEQVSEIEQTHPEDEKSSSFPFGDLPSDITSLYEHSSVDKEDLNSVDNSFFANLAAEENANSLPSGTDETIEGREDSIQETDDTDMLEENSKNDNSDNDEEELSKIINSDNEENSKVIHFEDDSKSRDFEEMLPKEEEEEEVIENEVALDINSEMESKASTCDNAMAEDLLNGQNSSDTKADPDTEMVSEDELPSVAQPKVQDAEEVSDDELPGPKLAELPADTEVVSEDELPQSAKKESNKRKVDEGYDPGSPTESTEIPEKKTKVDEELDNDADNDKKKKLPDLDKYWKAVNDDPADFTGWTYLLQYVDQENDIEAAREAYDAFLAHYPYCYGYWRKYADYEKRKGNKKKCEEVFERGLKAIPLSVDLWIHFLAHIKTNYGEDEEHVRSQFERALNSCGLEFRSDKLWEAYIKWETEGKRILNVVAIYDRLLATPTQGYNTHFDSFHEIVNDNTIEVLIDADEIKTLRALVRENIVTKEKSTTEEETTEVVPPVEEETEETIKNDEEENALVKDKILLIRRKIHKNTVAAVTERWTFEEGIKRPYFHVKPLERCQLKNWKEYLDLEIEKGDRKRILVLFERCLIACALYEEFWLKLIRYLETQNDAELAATTRDAFERACTVHHPDKPSLHLMWSAFEECQENYTKSADILTNLEKTCPNLLQVAYRRINLERRRGDYEKCTQLYEHYITNAKNKNIGSTLAIKYARFMHKIKRDISGGLEILKSSLEKDPTNCRLALQMIDLALQREIVDENEVMLMMDSFMSREGMELDQKVLFAQRKVEFLEDFGSTAKGLQDAQRLLHTTLSKANDAKKKASESSPSKKTGKDATNPPLPQSGTNSAATNYTNTYNYGGTTAQNSSNYYYGSGGQSAGYQSYGDYGSNSWSQYPQTGYSGYQWGSYGNYY